MLQLPRVVRSSGAGYGAFSSWPWWLAVLSCAVVAGDEGASPAGSAAQRREAFAEQMQGVVLEGFFVVDTPGGERPQPEAERYEIRGATYVGPGHLWRFDARISYGIFDVTVPLRLPVHWAGDTPVVTVDSVSIPGLGTFDALVLIEGDRYAGTWQHGEVGGHMFGRIRPAEVK